LLAFICTEYELYSCIKLPKTKVCECTRGGGGRRWGGASWGGEVEGGRTFLEGDTVEDGTTAEVGIDVQTLPSEAMRKSLEGELARTAILEEDPRGRRRR
jgi:hypothetical protein